MLVGRKSPVGRAHQHVLVLGVLACLASCALAQIHPRETSAKVAAAAKPEVGARPRQLSSIEPYLEERVKQLGLDRQQQSKDFSSEKSRARQLNSIEPLLKERAKQLGLDDSRNHGSSESSSLAPSGNTAPGVNPVMSVNSEQSRGRHLYYGIGPAYGQQVATAYQPQQQQQQHANYGATSTVYGAGALAGAYSQPQQYSASSTYGATPAYAAGRPEDLPKIYEGNKLFLPPRGETVPAYSAPSNTHGVALIPPLGSSVHALRPVLELAKPEIRIYSASKSKHRPQSQPQKTGSSQKKIISFKVVRKHEEHFDASNLLQPEFYIQEEAYPVLVEQGVKQGKRKSATTPNPAPTTSTTAKPKPTTGKPQTITETPEPATAETVAQPKPTARASDPESGPEKEVREPEKQESQRREEEQPSEEKKKEEEVVESTKKMKKVPRKQAKKPEKVVEKKRLSEQEDEQHKTPDEQPQPEPQQEEGQEPGKQKETAPEEDEQPQREEEEEEAQAQPQQEEQEQEPIKKQEEEQSRRQNLAKSVFNDPSFGEILALRDLFKSRGALGSSKFSAQGAGEANDESQDAAPSGEERIKQAANGDEAQLGLGRAQQRFQASASDESDENPEHHDDQDVNQVMGRQAQPPKGLFGDHDEGNPVEELEDRMDLLGAILKNSREDREAVAEAKKVEYRRPLGPIDSEDLPVSVDQQQLPTVKSESEMESQFSSLRQALSQAIERANKNKNKNRRGQFSSLGEM